MRCAEKAWTGSVRTGEGTGYVPEQGRHGLISANGRTVYLNKSSGDLLTLLFEFEMRRASCDLPATVGPMSSIGSIAADHNMFDRVDELIKRGVRVSMPDFRNELP